MPGVRPRDAQRPKVLRQVRRRATGMTDILSQCFSDHGARHCSASCSNLKPDSATLVSALSEAELSCTMARHEVRRKEEAQSLNQNILISARGGREVS